MKPKTVFFVGTALLLGGAYLHSRRKRASEEWFDYPQAVANVRDAHAPLPIAAVIAEPAARATSPGPPGGWRAYATVSASKAAIEGCRVDEPEMPAAEAATCALRSLFREVQWPPDEDAEVWQKQAWEYFFAAADDPGQI